MRKMVFLVAVVLLVSAASAEVIGPWKSTTTYMWETQPIVGYTCGSTSISGTPPNDVLLQPGPTGMTKNTTFLPYSVVDPNWAEKLACAQLIMPSGTDVYRVHAKIFDPIITSTHKSGWALVLKGADGKLLDFGVRGYFKKAIIAPREFNGTTWPTYVGSGNWSPQYARAYTGNNYYTIDIWKNADGTLHYVLDAYENGTAWQVSGDTVTSYGAITQIFLSTSTPDSTGAVNYKWTEFDYAVPEPCSIIGVGFGFAALVGLLARRKE